MTELDPTKRTFGVTATEGKWFLCCDCPSDEEYQDLIGSCLTAVVVETNLWYGHTDSRGTFSRVGLNPSLMPVVALPQKVSPDDPTRTYYHNPEPASTWTGNPPWNMDYDDYADSPQMISGGDFVAGDFGPDSEWQQTGNSPKYPTEAKNYIWINCTVSGGEPWLPPSLRSTAIETVFDDRFILSSYSSSFPLEDPPSKIHLEDIRGYSTHAKMDRGESASMIQGTKAMTFNSYGAYLINPSLDNSDFADLPCPSEPDELVNFFVKKNCFESRPPAVVEKIPNKATITVGGVSQTVLYGGAGIPGFAGSTVKPFRCGETCYTTATREVFYESDGEIDYIVDYGTGGLNVGQRAYEGSPGTPIVQPYFQRVHSYGLDPDGLYGHCSFEFRIDFLLDGKVKWFMQSWQNHPEYDNRTFLTTQQSDPFLDWIKMGEQGATFATINLEWDPTQEVNSGFLNPLVGTDYQLGPTSGANSAWYYHEIYNCQIPYEIRLHW